MRSIFLFVLLIFSNIMEAQQLNTNYEKITLGGGCFWCTEAVFQNLKGVVKVESGYSGGHTKNPSYREVCNGTTGHAEVIQITFDNKVISEDEILKLFFAIHDPTSLNRQGADVGTQYRSVIFYHNSVQQQKAKQIINDLNNSLVYKSKIVTELSPFTVFYKAEDYHQNYYNNNKEAPYCKMVIVPKLEKANKLLKK
ncbi:MAG: peptide-methionine (S)-S-oxide reductase MsrA [Bacteroidia bacterium]|nr:peptide-methionine (S)-S-oxide reductase MsrA [Bacteroidia bacterium]MCZ2248568.1 peptide-methionine (S)-S-oxide reductase MsrA [Bacteroidia bacterium]